MTSTASEELNGEVSVTNDTVPSVHNNIFFKNFGRPSRHHSQNRYEESRKRNGSDADMLADDDIGEYHPGSGFVSRLLGRFSNLSAKDENVVTPRLKRSSSLEGDVTIEKESLKKPLSNRETSRAEYEKPGPSFSKLSHKTGSIESLNHSHRSRPAYPVSLRHVEKRGVNSADKPLKSPRESQIIAPDADLARDDIVIIEKSPVPPLVLDKSDESKEDNVPQITSYRDEVPIEELPKPNTVLNVRSFFETASSGSVTYNKRHKSDSFSDVKNESSALNRDRRPSPVTSPRILSYDSAPPSWLSRRNSTDTLYTSTRRGSTDTSEVSNTTSSNFRSDTATNYTKSSSNAERSPSVSNPEVTSHFSKDSTKSYSPIFENGKTLDASRPAPSPRSTASVKPTLSSKPVSVVNVKPIPISNPPSTATSFEKRQVAPVAPFKKQEEKEDDGTPVMIYQKPKSPTRKVRAERTKKYEELPAKANKEKSQSEGKNFIIPTEKNKFEKENEVNRNKSVTMSSDSSASELRTFENNQVNNHEKTFSFIKPTVNDEADYNNVPKRNNKESSSLSVGKDKTTISITGNKTQISISSDSQGKLETKKYKAPVPQKADLAKPEREFNKASRAPEPPVSKPAKGDKPQSMIYLSSSSDTSESESSPPETPRTEPTKVSERIRISEPLKPPRAEPERMSKPVNKPEEVKVPEPENTEQPVKGIPSIIAKRLNKQNNSPRDFSNSIANQSEPEPVVGRVASHTIDDKPLSFRDNLESMKNAENANQQPSKEAVNSEIENQIAAVRKKMDSSRSKGSGPAQIFDSSQLAKKRQENKRQKAAAAAAAQGIVPRLDFSSLNEDKSKNERMVQKEIKPCNIKFIGENTKTSRSLLKKQRRVKANVQFSETISKTFEYPNEEQALECYLADHPNEPRELEEEENSIVFIDGFGGGGGDMGESSDDVDEGENETTVDTPRREVGAEENLKSNPALSGSGTTLQSYRGRFQEEFVFGSNMSDPEPAPQPSTPEPSDDSESMMLRPAEEESVNIWSTNDSSDLLF